AASRLRQRDLPQRLVQLATAWLQTRNPRAALRGEAEPEPGTRLRWQARALTPLTSGAPFPGGSYSPFRLALYELEVTVSTAAAGETRFTLQRLGLERDPVTELVPTR
ncbi:MAG: hypothetical protein MUF08_02295, partial [Burkholderiaceae bacterium]|nr:hypothetical protein [Burkholderiaceae bacterium]